MATPEDLRAQAAGGTFCIVPYCHPDFAWTHHREWHEERYAVSTAEALDLMREDPEFRSRSPVPVRQRVRTRLSCAT